MNPKRLQYLSVLFLPYKENNFALKSVFPLHKNTSSPLGLGSWQAPPADILLTLLHGFGWAWHVPLTPCHRDSKKNLFGDILIADTYSSRLCWVARVRGEI